MLIETALESYPEEIQLKDGFACQLRPLEPADEKDFHQFFLAIPERERMFIKHRVTDPATIRDWCQNIDLGRNLPLLAFVTGKIIGVTTLHQQLGGWKRHVGRVSVMVHPEFRGHGLGRKLVMAIVDIARNISLEKIEAEFLSEQEAAMKLFGVLGFHPLVRLQAYVKDMQAVSHDYVLMGIDLETDEEYASAG